MNKDISANLNQKYLILGRIIILQVLHNMILLPAIKGFSGHLKRSTLIFTNGA